MQRDNGGEHVSGHRIHEIPEGSRRWDWLTRGLCLALISFVIWKVGERLLERANDVHAEQPNWVGRVWMNGPVTLYKEPNAGSPVEVTGLPEGPIEIHLESEMGERLEGIVVCGDHGGVTGGARLELLPRNELRLTLLRRGMLENAIRFTVNQPDVE